MSHDNDRTGQSSYHIHDFNNTAATCPCGAVAYVPKPSTTAEPIVFPHVDPNPTIVDGKINGGSPIGPGFVVFERAKGEYGYDLKLAKMSVGKGWGVLLETLFARIAWDKEHNAERSPFVHMVVTQVKEKFGALRVYWYIADEPEKPVKGWDKVDGFVSALESMSTRICELCGKPGTLRPRSWVVTLCDDCYADPKSPAKKHGLEQRDDA